MAETKALALRPERAALAERVDQISISAQRALSGATGFAVTLAVAQAVVDLQETLTEEAMAPVLRLAGSPLGFLCDRQYDAKTIRDCVIEAQLRGFSVVGNEFNVISGRFYAAKAGLRRKVTTWPALAEFRDVYGVPQMRDGGAVVHAKATWKLDGKDDALEMDIAVRLNSGMGADGALGKAERKLLKRIHDRLAGWQVADGEVGDEAAVEVRVTAPPPPPPARSAPVATPSGPATQATPAQDTAPAAATGSFDDLIHAVDEINAALMSATTQAELDAAWKAVPAAMREGRLTVDERKFAEEIYKEVRARIRSAAAAAPGAAP